MNTLVRALLDFNRCFEDPKILFLVKLMMMNWVFKTSLLYLLMMMDWVFKTSLLYFHDLKLNVVFLCVNLECSCYYIRLCGYILSQICVVISFVSGAMLACIHVLLIAGRKSVVTVTRWFSFLPHFSSSIAPFLLNLPA